MIAFAFLSPYILNALHLPYQNEGYKPNLLTSIFFLENYKMMITNSFPDGAPLRVMWSLCIEEHFYIIWGLLFYFITTKKIPFLIILSIIIPNIIRPIYTHLGINHVDILSNLDYFAFGAIPAYVLMYKNHFLDYIEKIPKNLKYIFLILTLAVVFIIPNITLSRFDFLFPSLLGLLFSITLLFTLGKNSIYINDNLWISKLGVYTYGLYLYHTIIILLFIRIFKYLSISNWYVFGLVTLVVTVFISMISYHLFEKQFLKLKKKFY